MNTLYVCFLYSKSFFSFNLGAQRKILTYCNLYFNISVVNVQNIIQAADPFEVLLNALALEFVGQIDEEFANSKWWDNDRRWIR